MKKILLFTFLLTTSSIFTQNVGIGTNSPDPSAKLDIQSIDQGFLPPRIDLTASNSASPITLPATGLLVYNKATAGTSPNNVSPGYYYWDGTVWIRLDSQADSDWFKTGTTNTPNNISDNQFTEGKVSIGSSASPTHTLTISNTTDNNTVRLIGNGALGSEARLNFGDGDFVYIDEMSDDELRIHASGSHVQIDGSLLRVGDAGTPNGVSGDGDLFVENDAQIAGYLKVGNPTAATGALTNNVQLYDLSPNPSYWNFINSICNTADGGIWSLGANFLEFNNTGARHYRALHSPYMWLPININDADLKVSLNHDCSLENGFDGVYLELSEDGGNTWSSVSSWNTNGYTAGVDGSNTGCLNANIPAWTANSFAGLQTSISNPITAVYQPGSWLRFKLIGMEDGSVGTGTYQLFNFKLLADNVSYGNSNFAIGDIYAEGHVFAQSTIQLGDVAEFFPVREKTEAGDLISMNSGNSNLCYLSNTENADLVIGVQSTSPSILVNNPNEGVPIALSGRVPVKVNNENGNIKPGDYLTASSTKGYAMKATKPSFIVGRAMESLESDKGKIICMVGPGWYNPNPASESVLSGDSKINKGKKEITIYDKNITKYSRVFITLRDNPGTFYWISQVKDGSFNLNFNSEISNTVNFDYLVNNASSSKEIKETVESIITKKAIPKTSNKKKSLNNIKINSDSEFYFIDSEGRKIEGITVSENPPKSPPDVNNAWTWDPINGFKKFDLGNLE